MKNSQKGFVVPILLGIVALLIVSGGVYIYKVKKGEVQKVEVPVVVNTEVQTTQTQQTNTKTSPVTNQPVAVVLDLSSSFARQYKTVLTESFKKPANFGVHYVVAEIGCGTGCFTFIVIDKNTGKVYPAPIGNDIGQFTGDIGQPYNLNSNQIKIIANNGSKINTYVFTGSSFSLLSSENSQSFDTQTKVCSNAGMSVKVPNESKYECDTEVARVFGNGAVALNVSYKNNSYKSNSASISSYQVVSMYKFSNQVLFNEGVPQDLLYSDFTLINSKYSISGTTGSYYNQNLSNGGGSMIVIPSKLIIISIDPASYIGISQTTLDSIVASISL